MAKLMAVGVAFPFWVSFWAVLRYGALLVSGTGNCIAVDCVSLVSCLGVGYVCKGVGLEGKYSYWERLQMWCNILE